jgi:hypothetical protein
MLTVFLSVTVGTWVSALMLAVSLCRVAACDAAGPLPGAMV